MNTRQPHRASQGGFSMIEVMIALVLGLFIVLALVTLLINVNRSNSEMSKSNRVIENGRFALQLLEADVQLAGFWGGFVPGFDDLTNKVIPTDVPTAIPDPCLDYASWDAAYKTNLIGIPVQVYSLSSTVPAPTVCTSKAPYPKVSTDVLFVRHVENCISGASGCSAAAGEVYFQLSQCGTDSSYVLDTTGFTKTKRNCTTLGDKYKFVSNMYYIRDYAVTVGDGIPALVRSQFGNSGGTPQHLTPEVMVEGVEGFRVMLGIDTIGDTGLAADFTRAIEWVDSTNLTSPKYRGDGLPDGAFVRCASGTPCTASQFMNTVSLQIYVLIRAENKTPGYTDTKTYQMGPSSGGGTTLGPFNDGYKRHLFMNSVRLVNVSMRRETP